MAKGYSQIIFHVSIQLNRRGQYCQTEYEAIVKKHFINNTWKLRKCPILTSSSQHLINYPWLFPHGTTRSTFPLDQSKL